MMSAQTPDVTAHHNLSGVRAVNKTFAKLNSARPGEGEGPYKGFLLVESTIELSI